MVSDEEALNDLELVDEAAREEAFYRALWEREEAAVSRHDAEPDDDE